MSSWHAYMVVVRVVFYTHSIEFFHPTISIWFIHLFIDIV